MGRALREWIGFWVYRLRVSVDWWTRVIGEKGRGFGGNATKDPQERRVVKGISGQSGPPICLFTRSNQSLPPAVGDLIRRTFSQCKAPAEQTPISSEIAS
jgi:hypothetical protein